jgi:transcription elongation factor GreB
MSKAFTTEETTANEPEDDNEADALPVGLKNYMTPEGFATLQAELHNLLSVERPKIVEIVSWAAGNGDRSENGDYLYGKKRLREIDRRLRYLDKRMENAEVVDPSKQKNLDRVFFGATVTYARGDGGEHTTKIVGLDEARAGGDKISWVSPLARAMMKARSGDVVILRTPGGTEEIEIVSISYKT